VESLSFHFEKNQRSQGVERGSCLLDDSPGGLVDTVKELTDILLLNLGSLLDLRNRGTNSLDGVADKPDFILFRGPVDLDALLHVDAEGNL